METKEKKSFLTGMPSWALSIITVGFSTFLLFLLAHIFAGVEKFSQDNIGELIAYFSFAIVIVIACFFICREYPNSVWYVPIICNIMGIMAAFGEENFWITPLWMIVCGGWVLSLIGALVGHLVGH